MGEIEWTGRSDWNPIRGCTRVSEGCRNCYAEAIAARFSGPGQPFEGFAERTANGPRWTGKVALMEDRLTLPLKWRKPAKVFVNSAFDLFHESVPDAWIDRIFAVMALAPQHTFQILTKRSSRMQEYFAARTSGDPWAEAADEIADMIGMKEHPVVLEPADIPLPNVWLGVTVEDQPRADDRIPDLLATPAATRFVSIEPMLGPVDLFHVADGGGFTFNALSKKEGIAFRGTGLDWVIAGGESGPNARPMRLDWFRDLLDQCRAASVPFFGKQLGPKCIMNRSDAVQAVGLGAGWEGRSGHASGLVTFRHRKGGDLIEWPADLRVQEFPASVIAERRAGQ